MSITYKAIDPESGIRWCVRIVFFGDNYGRNHCLTYGDKEFDKKMNEPMIEFYDMDSGAAAIMRNSDDKTEAYLAEEYGQFVSRYYLSSLKFEERFDGKTLTDWSKRGLTLHGGVDRWSVSSEFMVDAMAAVEAELEDRAELERREEDKELVLSPVEKERLIRYFWKEAHPDWIENWLPNDVDPLTGRYNSDSVHEGEEYEEMHWDGIQFEEGGRMFDLCMHFVDGKQWVEVYECDWITNDWITNTQKVWLMHEELA